MKLVFFGTPKFAIPSLLSLHKSGHEILAVVTASARVFAAAVVQNQSLHIPKGREGLQAERTVVLHTFVGCVCSCVVHVQSNDTVAPKKSRNARAVMSRARVYAEGAERLGVAVARVPTMRGLRGAAPFEERRSAL